LQKFQAIRQMFVILLLLQWIAFPAAGLADEDKPAITALQDIDPNALTQPPAANPSAPVLKGNVSVDKNFTPDVVFDDMHTLGKGEILILTMLDMVSSGYSSTGEEFEASVKVPVMQDGKVLIPEGTMVKGHVIAVEDAGPHLAKRGRIVLGFDYLLMTDGRRLPFKSDFAEGDSGAQQIKRTIANGIGGTVKGAVQGVMVGLQYGGLLGAVLTHGVTVAAGGGLGALNGLGTGLNGSGSEVLINEGDVIKVALQEPLSLPEVVIAPDKTNELQAPGLNVQIADYKLGCDPFKVENMIHLTLKIDNQTDYQFGSFDMALIDEYNDVFQLSPFSQDDLYMFQIKPHSKLTGSVSFNVKAPGLRHYLVFYKPYTRDIIAKISLKEALKSLSAVKVKGNAS